MSGSFVSTGMLTNKGDKLSEKEITEIMNLKIIDLSVLIIPLFLNSGVTVGRALGRIFFQSFIHPAIFSPTLSHIAIQLTLEKDYIVIIEYGQYYSNESEINNTSKFASLSKSSNSSQNCREETKKFQFYYINKDGVRLTIIHKDIIYKLDDINYDEGIHYNYLNSDDDERKKISFYAMMLMACNYYKLPYYDFIEKRNNLSSSKDFGLIECDIKNKIK